MIVENTIITNKNERFGESRDILEKYGWEDNVKGPSIMIFLGFSMAVLLFEWLAIVLLGRVFPMYLSKSVRIIYGAVALLSMALLYASRYVPIGTFPEAMLKGAFWLLAAPFALLIALPAIYALFRVMGVRPSKPSESRRTLIKRAGIAVPVLCYSSMVYGVFDKAGDLVVNRYAVAVQDLPTELTGLRIAQLSDVHLGVFVSLDKLDEMLRLTEAERPDMLVITGDFIDGVGWTEEAMARVARLAEKLPYGAYFCWGNHEYLRDKDRIARALDAYGVRALKNESVCVIEGRRPLWLLGVDYPWARDLTIREGDRERMMAKAMADVPTDAVKVLLAHHSDFIEQGVKYGIDLTLTGHTHGGQFAIGQTAFLPVQYRYMRGFYGAGGALGDIRGGAADAPTKVGHGQPIGYVNSGAGSWFPLRFGCPPEIAIFTLARNEDS
ncbi:MAG: metallophosphoesterase [Selenomonadales bacterium]|nr:metallophosphoesterase [Selenomonadales bacterium]